VSVCGWLWVRHVASRSGLFCFRSVQTLAFAYFVAAQSWQAVRSAWASWLSAHALQAPLEDRNMAGELALWWPQSSTDECSLTLQTPLPAAALARDEVNQRSKIGVTRGSDSCPWARQAIGTSLTLNCPTAHLLQTLACMA